MLSQQQQQQQRSGGGLSRVTGRVVCATPGVQRTETLTDHVESRVLLSIELQIALYFTPLTKHRLDFTLFDQ